MPRREAPPAASCPENGAIVAGAIIAGEFIVGAIIAGAFIAGAIIAGAIIDGTIVVGVNFPGALVAGVNFVGVYRQCVHIKKNLSCMSLHAISVFDEYEALKIALQKHH